MRLRRSVTASVLLVICSILLPSGRVAADQEQPCGDTQWIHARGSGDSVNDDFFNRVNQQLSDRLDIPPIAYSTYQLGKDGGFGGHEYPADRRDERSPAVDAARRASIIGSID
jgi:hypothetical protein